MAGLPPDWYADPSDNRQQRWWDGFNWRAEVRVRPKTDLTPNGKWATLARTAATQELEVRNRTWAHLHEFVSGVRIEPIIMPCHGTSWQEHNASFFLTKSHGGMATYKCDAIMYFFQLPPAVYFSLRGPNIPWTRHYILDQHHVKIFDSTEITLQMGIIAMSAAIAMLVQD